MRVMVIGASSDPSKYGHRAVQAYVRQGHDVLPVNPAATEIAGMRAYANVSEPPGPIDRATVYLPPDVGLRVLPELAARGDVKELWINPGAESEALIAEARRLGFEPIQACSIVDIGERP